MAITGMRFPGLQCELVHTRAGSRLIPRQAERQRAPATAAPNRGILSAATAGRNLCDRGSRSPGRDCKALGQGFLNWRGRLCLKNLTVNLLRLICLSTGESLIRVIAACDMGLITPLCRGTGPARMACNYCCAGPPCRTPAAIQRQRDPETASHRGRSLAARPWMCRDTSRILKTEAPRRAALVRYPKVVMKDVGTATGLRCLAGGPLPAQGTP
jgi:hypothetical protein